MGKQTGPNFRTGTIGPVTYYKLFGEHYYLRAKSSLTGQRFWKDPAFARSRKRSKDFGGAAQLASQIYKLLPKKNRGKGFMGKFIGRVHRLLLDGFSPEAIQAEALREFGVVQLAVKPVIEKQPTKERRRCSRVQHWVVTTTGGLQQQPIPYDSYSIFYKSLDD